MKKIYHVKVNGKTYKVELESVEEVASSQKTVEAKSETKPATSSGSTGAKQVPCPMAGRIIDVKTKVGDTVKKGQTLFIVEAMKLENEVGSPFDGTVKEILIKKGDSVTAKQVVITLD